MSTLILSKFLNFAAQTHDSIIVQLQGVLKLNLCNTHFYLEKYSTILN